MTKQSYFWATPSGPINLIKAEDMPVMKYWPEGTPMYSDYNAALQRAKESSVPIQDQDEAWRIIFPDLKDACEFEVVGDSISYKMGNYGIFALPIIPDTIHGPFTVEYEIQELHYCKLCGAYKSIKRIPCQNAYCGKTTERVAILYDYTPEKEHSSLREALREVKAKNRELRDSYNDPTRLDFRIKDSRGFPTGEVVDEAKVVPEKETQEQIFDDMFCKYFDYIYQEKKSSYHACLEIQKEFTITRKQ